MIVGKLGDKILVINIEFFYKLPEVNQIAEDDKSEI